MDDVYAEESTDTESINDFPPMKNIVGTNWVLHQNQGLDDPVTDNSDIENFEYDDSCMGRSTIRMKKVPSDYFKDVASSKTCSCLC